MEYTFIVEKKTGKVTHRFAINTSAVNEERAKARAEVLAKERGYSLVDSDSCCDGFLTLRCTPDGELVGWRA